MGQCKYAPIEIKNPVTDLYLSSYSIAKNWQLENKLREIVFCCRRLINQRIYTNWLHLTACV